MLYEKYLRHFTTKLFIKIIMESILNEIEFLSNPSIKNMSSIKIDGYVKGIFYPKNQQELIKIYDFLIKNEVKFKIIGNGSNILFSPNAQNLFLISSSKLPCALKVKEEQLSCSAGCKLSQAFSYATKHSLGGLEMLAQIPASVGGAIYMNAGAFGRSILDVISQIKVYQNGVVKYLKPQQIQSGYRNGIKDCLILGCTFQLCKDSSCDIFSRYSSYSISRGQKQPKGLSLGCTFKNPSSYSAGYLIEQCGLKGTKIGGAIISPKHANFIINEGNATYSDVMALIELCEKEVKRKFGIELEKEIEIF